MLSSGQYQQAASSYATQGSGQTPTLYMPGSIQNAVGGGAMNTNTNIALKVDGNSATGKVQVYGGLINQGLGIANGMLTEGLNYALASQALGAQVEGLKAGYATQLGIAQLQSKVAIKSLGVQQYQIDANSKNLQMAALHDEQMARIQGSYAVKMKQTDNDGKLSLARTVMQGDAFAVRQSYSMGVPATPSMSFASI